MIDYERVETKLFMLCDKMNPDKEYVIQYQGTFYELNRTHASMWLHYAIVQDTDPDIAWNFILHAANQLWEQINGK